MNTKKDTKTDSDNITGTTSCKSAEGRERILKAAEELFIERGFDGVSVNDVAEKAEVAKALIFYHFNNKIELFNAILDRYYLEQSNALKTAISVKGSIRDRMHAGIDAYLDYITKNPGYPRLIQGEICTNARGLDKMLEHMEPLNLWGEAVIGKSLPQEGPLAPKHLFISIFGMIVSYFNYMPVISKLWPDDPLEQSAVKERREHIHWVVDAILDKLET